MNFSPSQTMALLIMHYLSVFAGAVFLHVVACFSVKPTFMKTINPQSHRNHIVPWAVV